MIEYHWVQVNKLYTEARKPVWCFKDDLKQAGYDYLDSLGQVESHLNAYRSTKAKFAKIARLTYRREDTSLMHSSSHASSSSSSSPTTTGKKQSSSSSSSDKHGKQSIFELSELN